MSTLIREVKLIKAEAKVNSNKWWTGQLFDDGTVKATWGRVGYKGDSGQWNRGEKYFDKKTKELKEKNPLWYPSETLYILKKVRK